MNPYRQLLAPLCLATFSTCMAGMQTNVLMLPVTGADPTKLETTIHKPEGPGPFPLAVLNHGRIMGPQGPRPYQKREDFRFAATELVKLGYLVAIPMRRGYAGSGGQNHNVGCDMRGIALSEAADIKDAVDALVTRPDVDAKQILLVGQSMGGIAVTAFSSQYPDYPGVKGIINFAGGLRRPNCDWATSEVNAYARFGKTARLPMLWFYGANDSFWGPSSGLPTQFHKAYTENDGVANFVQFGRFSYDAHRLLGDWQGVEIWLQPVQAYMQERGLPIAVTGIATPGTK